MVKQILLVFVLFVSCALIQAAVNTDHLFAQSTDTGKEPVKATEKKEAPVAKTQKTTDPYAKEITKKGKVVLVSKKFVDMTKEDHAIVLSKVAVKQRLDENGKVSAYQLVQVDRGSSVEKMGFKAGDQLISVNGIPAKDLKDNQKNLEQENKFEVTVVRKGKKVKLFFEVQ
jgi:predicted metalloprotease with PDZ domain